MFHWFNRYYQVRNLLKLYCNRDQSMSKVLESFRRVNQNAERKITLYELLCFKSLRFI